MMAAGALALYVRTAAPSVATVFDDSLEFQVVLPTLGIAHPSGYPLYTLLGKLATLVPLRDPAGRANLFSALCAAAAIGLLYLIARRVAGSRPAAVIATAGFALVPAWWSQATLAEVYALHGLLLALFLYCLLRWEEAVTAGQGDRWLVAAALAAGLGLAHHRMIALLAPATLVFVIWTAPRLLREPRRWVSPALGLIVPLLLYLYLPLRGAVMQSLDGTFAPTLRGTLDWVTARGYSVFLTGNPFNVQRGPADVIALVLDQFGVLMLVAALMGMVHGARLAPRRWTLLMLGTVAQALFASAYKVQDVEVFFIPVFMLGAVWAAWGLAPLFDSLAQRGAVAARSLHLPSWTRPLVLGAWALPLAAVMLAEPVYGAVRDWGRLDRSQSWDVYDYGLDLASAPEPGGNIVGLLGQTTLVRYFRDVLGERPDLQVSPADDELARFAAVDAALAAGTPVYLTQDLPGASGRYSLDSVGPLVRVSPKATAALPPAGFDLGGGVLYLDGRAEVRPARGGRWVRAWVTWSVVKAIAEDLKVSARLLDPAGAQIAADDRVPVAFTYPTTAWVPGERVEDVYDLRVPPGAAPGSYRVALILYRATDGGEVGRVELPPFSLP